MNVIVFGYRGSGKTTIGRLVAQRLGLAFADVDQQTCQRFNNPSIAAIWKEHGEPAWRAAEVQVTRRLCAADGQVIALGGGTLMQPGARQAVEAAAGALRVYLAADSTVLLARISADPDSSATRPNLTGMGGGIEEIRAMLAQRDPVYRAAADSILDVSHLSPQDAAQTIAAWAQKKTEREPI